MVPQRAHHLGPLYLLANFVPLSGWFLIAFFTSVIGLFYFALVSQPHPVPLEVDFNLCRYTVYIWLDNLMWTHVLSFHFRLGFFLLDSWPLSYSGGWTQSSAAFLPCYIAWAAWIFTVTSWACPPPPLFPPDEVCLHFTLGRSLELWPNSFLP